MISKTLYRLAVMLLLAAPISTFGQQELGTAFTYEGRLILDGLPVDASADFEFRIWDAESGGDLIGSVVTVSDISVSNGLFTVELDFGADVFNGDARWLEVDVRTPESVGDYVTLSPRQLLSSTPYSLHTRGIFVDEAGNVGIDTDEPLGQLHVHHTANPSIQFENTGDTSAERNVTLDFVHQHGDGAQIRAVRQPGNENGMDLAFSTQPIDGGVTRRMTIDSEGRVGIGIDAPTAALEVRGDVKTSSGDTNVDQTQELASTTAPSLDGLLWQSFRAGEDGLLDQVDLRLHFLNTAESGTLVIYLGEGISGQVLSSQSVTLPSGVEQWMSFPISSAPGVVAGEIYTIAMFVETGELRLSASNGDPYPDGHMDLDIFVPTFDLAFRTYVRSGGVIVAGAFTGNGAGLTNLPDPWSKSGTWLIYEGGNVGIGTEDPVGQVHIASESDASMTITNTASSSSSISNWINFQHSNAVGARISGSRDSGDENGMALSFGTEPSGGNVITRMNIDRDGKVGIGISGSAAAELDVNGLAAVEAVTFPDNTSQSTAFPTTDVYTVSAGDFIARNSDWTCKTLDQGGVGGSFITAGSDILIAPLNLPQGVTITSVTYYGYDTISTTNLEMYIGRPETFSEGYFIVADNTSDVSSGAYSATVETNYTIDNTDTLYFVGVEPQGGTWHSAGLLAVNAVVIQYTYE